MKIIFATKEQVEHIWNKLQPQQRVYGDIGLSVKLPWEDAVVVSESSQLEFGKIEGFDSNSGVGDLRKKIERGRVLKVGTEACRVRTSGFEIKSEGKDETL